jgi:hypothetical protein
MKTVEVEFCNGCVFNLNREDGVDFCLLTDSVVSKLPKSRNEDCPLLEGEMTFKAIGDDVPKKRNLLEDLQELLNDEDYMKERAAEIKIKHEIEENHKARIQEYLATCRNPCLDIIEFLKWEEKWEDTQREVNHVLTESNIFSALSMIVQEEGEDVFHLQENEYGFLGGAWLYRGLTFSLFGGQGSFWRVEKDNEHIFQST